MYSSDPDKKDLIEMARKGQKQAFSQLVKMYYGLVMHFLLDRGLGHADAEDIAQETFLKAYSKVHQLSSAGSFAGWLLRIARNVWIDRFRKLQRQKNHTEESDLDELFESRSPEVIALDNAAVYDVYSTLKPRETVIIDLRVFQQLSFSEIAEIIGSKESNVRLIFHRTMKKLRNQSKENLK